MRITITPTAGTHTYGFWAGTVAGSTFQVAGDPSFPTVSFINDVGPV